MVLRPEPLAAIDIGSNSFRLEIGQVDEGRYRRVDYLKESVRLGAGLDAQGMLTDEASERGLKCLRGFARRLDGFDAQRVRAVATQTLREARNRNAFLLRAQAVLGFTLEVISGREEARLIYAGVSRLQPSEQRRLVIDIGGRSTELILGQGLVPKAAESFGAGCVSLSMRFFADGKFNATAFKAAQTAAEAEFEEAVEAFAPAHWQEALGSSGTVGAVSQVLAAAGITDGTITPAGLRWCMDRCIEQGKVDKLRLPGLKGDRAAVIGGGLAILMALCATLGVERLLPARGALRQGVIFDLAERLDPSAALGGGGLRERSIAELQRRFSADLAQASRVRRVALSLFDQACPEAGTPARTELGWACDVHEVGQQVSHHDHHRHSAYLVAHADLAGFSQSQQRHLADLVLGQRGGLRKLEEAFVRNGFAAQVLALRLAVIKCHARGKVDEGELSMTLGTAPWLVEFSELWAAANPRTLFLLQEEAEAWRRGAPATLALKARGVA